MCSRRVGIFSIYIAFRVWVLKYDSVEGELSLPLLLQPSLHLFGMVAFRILVICQLHTYAQITYTSMDFHYRLELM